MRTKNTSDYIIAATVVACSLVLLAALTMALTGFNLSSLGGRSVRIDFPSVAGVRINSDVRYAGKHVGTVREIMFLKPEERLDDPEYVIRVTAQLDNDAPPLYVGTTAAIISDTVLAEKFIDLIPVSIVPDEKNLPPLLGSQDVIKGKRVIGFDDLTRSGQEVIVHVNKILTDIRSNCPDLSERIQTLLQSSEELISRVNKMVQENDVDIQKAITDLRVTVQNLKVATTYAKALTRTVGERPWSIIWGGDHNELPSEKEILQSSEPLPAPILPKEEEGQEEDEEEEKESSDCAKSKPSLHQTSKGKRLRKLKK